MNLIWIVDNTFLCPAADGLKRMRKIRFRCARAAALRGRHVTGLLRFSVRRRPTRLGQIVRLLLSPLGGLHRRRLGQIVRLLLSPLGGLHRRRWLSRLPSSLVPHDESERSPHRLARVVAIVAGILGALLCTVVPLLPVTQTTATILWPQGLNADGHITDITAPLVSGAPRALDISIPCGAIATLPADGGLVVSTLPVNGFETGKSGLFVRANKDTVVVAFRDTVAAAAPRPAVAAGACSVV